MRLIGLTLICACQAYIAQAAQLTLDVSSKNIELGKYLNVTLLYEGETDPGDINFSPWQKDFLVDARAVEKEAGPATSLRITYAARLYPLHAGILTLRAIAHGGSFSKPLEINATAAMREGVDTTPIWQAMPSRIWADQALHVRIDMPLFHPSNLTAAEDFESSGFDVHPLTKTRGEAFSEDGSRLEIDRFQWLLFSPRAGLHKIQAPRLEQRGRGRLRFYLAQQSIEIMPIPSYLPATMPIGKPHLSSHVDWQSEPPQWVVKVRHQGRLPAEIYGLRRQMAALSGRSQDQVEIQTQRPLGIGIDAAEQTYRIALPRYQAPASLTPWQEPPMIRLAYFETQEHFTKTRLQYLPHQLPSTWQLPSIWQYLLLTLAIITLAVTARYLHIHLGRYQAGRARHSRLLQAKDMRTKRHLLLTDGDIKYSTLSEWAGNREPRKVTAEKIDAACFSRPEKTAF